MVYTMAGYHQRIAKNVRMKADQNRHLYNSKRLKCHAPITE